MKKVSASLKLELAQYHEMLAFAQFGSDLDPTTKKIIDHGARLTELLKQPQYQPLSMSEQVLCLYAAKNGILDQVDAEEVAKFAGKMLRDFHDKHADLMEELETSGKLSDELDAKIGAAMKAVLEEYQLVKGA
jgi:F-type H+-transporting ATPase subunit alpha